MSVDLLQEKIRKMKNPSVVDMTASVEQIPPHLLQECGSFCDAYGTFCRALLEGLKGIVPAVRFRFAGFVLMGQEGLALLKDLLSLAVELGYYVLLDSVEILSAQLAQMAADAMLSDSCPWQFHGLITSTYIGSDGLKPMVKKMGDKALFGVIRTGNKSAAELQDLFTGNRLSHTAAADLVNRLGEPMPARCGYNRIGALAGASSADSLKTLRTKYQRLFLLLDGYDYPNANAKNCSFAFDRFGHGAAACAGASVIAAWLDSDTDGQDYVAQAVEAAERMKKNLTRYVTIL